MTDEELKQYESTQRAAAVRVDGWFIQSPEHWRDKAQRIRELCQTWNQTWGRYKVEDIADDLEWLVDPMAPWMTAYGLGWNNPIVTADKLALPEPDTPDFHPILYWTLRLKPEWEYTATKGKRKVEITTEIPPFSERDTDKALACYYAALILLHDTVGQGYRSIAADIWPKSLWNLASCAFHPGYGDKSDFIDAAVRYVEADLQGAPNEKKPARLSAFRYENQVPWDGTNAAYYPNKDAITDAKKMGADHDIKELKKLDADKLNKLLRSPEGRAVHFMSRTKPPRGKVHRDDWDGYLRRQVDKHERFDRAVEQKARELVDQ